MNKKKILIIIGSIIVFIGLMTLFINIYMINSTKYQIISLDVLKGEYDAIIVLGCRVDGDSPSLMLAKRLQKGIDVYNKLNTKIIISGDYDGNNNNEVDVMKEYLLSEISSNDIFNF